MAHHPRSDSPDRVIARHLGGLGPVALSGEALRPFMVGTRPAHPLVISLPDPQYGYVTTADGRTFATVTPGNYATNGADNGRGRTAVIPVTGVIRPFGASAFERLFGMGGGGLTDIVNAVRGAGADAGVSRIVLAFHSPGGSTFGVDEAREAIADVAKSKPVIAVAQYMCASAAYWLATGATEIVAAPSAIVGACGVFATHEDLSKLNERVGIKITYIAQPPEKVDGNSDEPLSASYRKELQTRVDADYNRFAAAISSSRGVDMAKLGSQYARVHSGADAHRLGMIDRLATLENVLSANSAGATATRRAKLALLKLKG